MKQSGFPFRKVYGAPLLLALVTAYGLVSALLGDGIWDALSWLALAVPLLVLAWCYFRRRKPSTDAAMSR